MLGGTSPSLGSKPRLGGLRTIAVHGPLVQYKRFGCMMVGCAKRGGVCQNAHLNDAVVGPLEFGGGILR